MSRNISRSQSSSAEQEVVTLRAAKPARRSNTAGNGGVVNRIKMWENIANTSSALVMPNSKKVDFLIRSDSKNPR